MKLKRSICLTTAVLSLLLFGVMLIVIFERAKLKTGQTVQYNGNTKVQVTAYDLTHRLYQGTLSFKRRKYFEYNINSETTKCKYEETTQITINNAVINYYVAENFFGQVVDTEIIQIPVAWFDNNPRPSPIEPDKITSTTNLYGLDRFSKPKIKKAKITNHEQAHFYATYCYQSSNEDVFKNDKPTIRLTIPYPLGLKKLHPQYDWSLTTLTRLLGKYYDHVHQLNNKQRMIAAKYYIPQ